MHFPQFWQKVGQGAVSAWGWSDVSEDEARRRARERLERVLAALRNRRTHELSRYAYGDRPLREEVLRRFAGPDGAETALVTRNRYGALVLNSANLLFVDIDLPPQPRSGPVGWLKRLFGGGRSEPAETPPEEKLRERLQAWVAANPGWSWRWYRTRAGYRLMAVHQPVGVEDPVVERVFDHFEADPLYRRLCRVQQCYRARLTPKPWRCGVSLPPGGWPWPDEKARQAFERWNGDYLRAAAGRATCHWLGQVGAGEVHPELRPLVEFHDQTTRADSDAPLA
ncbi:MAG: hypothetical protein D6766_10150, partial [Verrucomicrobia bacterium]